MCGELPVVCFRLLAQLDETENAFEQFWCKHHLKLEQCLQLRHFEQDFREVYLQICLSPQRAWLPLDSNLWIFCLCLLYTQLQKTRRLEKNHTH